WRTVIPDWVTRAEPAFSMRCAGSKPFVSGVMPPQLEHPLLHPPPEQPAAMRKRAMAVMCLSSETAGGGLVDTGMRGMTKVLQGAVRAWGARQALCSDATRILRGVDATLQEALTCVYASSNRAKMRHVGCSRALPATTRRSTRCRAPRRRAALVTSSRQAASSP